MPTDELLQLFRSRLRGQLLQPGDDGYDSVRKVFNGMIDRHPRWIARCVDVADIRAGVDFARNSGVLLAIRGGNHSAPGLGMCDDGLVLDLSLMKGVHIDPVARTVRVAGGCVWGDVDHATHLFGLATPSGIVSTTGDTAHTYEQTCGHGFCKHRWPERVDLQASAAWRGIQRTLQGGCCLCMGRLQEG